MNIRYWIQYGIIALLCIQIKVASLSFFSSIRQFDSANRLVIIPQAQGLTYISMIVAVLLVAFVVDSYFQKKISGGQLLRHLVAPVLIFMFTLTLG